MGKLLGLNEYLKENYDKSIFDQALNSGQPWVFHLSAQRSIGATIKENLKFDLKIDSEEKGEEIIPKLQVKLLHPVDLSDSVKSLIKVDEKVKAPGLAPTPYRSRRYYIKNKTLFPLMQEKEVVFFTLLEGEIIRGLITWFSKYEITVSLKGGIPVTILRHGIYDLRNKQGRCFMKLFQQKHKDWKSSSLFIEEIAEVKNQT